MLGKTPPNIIAALSSLEGNSDFEKVCEWLDGCLQGLMNETAFTKDEVQTRWMQGATQVLSDFLSKKRAARDTLYKLK